MSLLIEMPEFEEEPVEEDKYQVLVQQVAALLHHPDFSAASPPTLTHNTLSLALPRGQLAFLRDTRWTLQLQNQQLRIWVTFYQNGGLNYLRAQSERMKLELMVVLRAVNSGLPVQQQFFVQPRSGMLRYSFILPWKDYRQKIKGPDALRKLFRYLLAQINLYAQIVLFCEPQAIQVQPGQSLHHPPNDLETINRYRFLLRNTRRFRQSNLALLEQAVQLKRQIRAGSEHLREQLDQLRSLFQNNISAFEQMRAGLEKTKEMEECLQHVRKNGEGKESRPPEWNIVSGIKIIQQVDVKSLSKEGAHSEILKGKFIYKLWKTINLEFSVNQAIWSDGKENRGELILKTCNLTEQSSINSFMNELCFLNHVRDSQSSYIAKYYLQVKRWEDRTEKDFIYMRPYFHNLYLIVKRCKTLTFEERLALAYKVSKGMCFLGAKGVLHRDLKPHNIMVDHSLNPFIIDFGSCAPAYRDSCFKVREDRLLTTPLFHVYYHEIPEDYAYLHSKFTREQYNRHPLFDVYSQGRILSYIFFNSLSPPSPDDLLTHPYPEMLKNVLFIITLCLQIDPDERPTFSEIASFLGTLKGYLTVIPRALDQRVRSLSQPPKPPPDRA